MAEEKTYPYATDLNVLHAPLELIDDQALADACTGRWYNQTPTRVNDAVVHLGVMQRDYHWHSHEKKHEFLFVIEGRFLIDLEGRVVELGPRQGFTVPRGTVHHTRAPERGIVPMVEAAGVVPTGD